MAFNFNFFKKQRAEYGGNFYSVYQPIVDIATGDVIGILNADDFLADDAVIERVADIFLTTKNTENAKIDVAYGDVRFVKNFKFCVASNTKSILNSSGIL
jgi:hypothetical protein